MTAFINLSVERIRRLALRVAGAALLAVAFHLPTAQAAEFDARAEIAAAVAALDNAHQNLGGMGGLGAIPEDDLNFIQDLLDAAERLIREARVRAQNASTPQDEAFIVAYARAGLAMAESANEYRSNRGY